MAIQHQEARDILTRVQTHHTVINPEATQSIKGVSALDRASEDEATFATVERLQDLSPNAGVVVTNAAPATLEALPQFSVTTWIITESPRKLIAELAGPFEHRTPRSIHPTASIDPSSVIGEQTAIGANATIGPSVVIGAHSTIHAGAVIQHATIGDNVVIGPGSVIGFAGFGYERSADDGDWIRLPHLGMVRIESDVEIGANTCIDRGTFGDTVIRTGARIDNLVHIAHNCEIGERALVIASAMVGGSVRVGAGAWIAPASALINGIRVGDRATTGLGAVVIRDVDPEETVVGVPARPLG